MRAFIYQALIFNRYKEFVGRIEIMHTIKTLNHTNVRWGCFLASDF